MTLTQTVQGGSPPGGRGGGRGGQAVRRRRRSGISYHAPDHHRGEARRVRRQTASSRGVRPSRVRAQRAFSLRRRLGDGGPGVHGHLQPGAGLHARNALQRLRDEAPHSDGGGQQGPERPPGPQRRPQRHDGVQGLRVDSALRRERRGDLRQDNPVVQALRRPEGDATFGPQLRGVHPLARQGEGQPARGRDPSGGSWGGPGPSIASTQTRR